MNRPTLPAALIITAVFVLRGAAPGRSQPAGPTEPPVARDTSTALELPLGVWDIWTETVWKYAVEVSNSGGPDLLAREFDRLNGLHATLLIHATGNEQLDVQAHRLGQLKPGIVLCSAAEYEDSAQVSVVDKRIPGGWPHLKQYRDVITRFINDADLNDPGVRENAFAILDDIVDSQQRLYGGDIAAAPYYLVLTEGWDRNGSRETNRGYSLLFEHTVERIRRHDPARGIICFADYAIVAKAEAFQADKLNDPRLLDSIFSGKLLRGWNVFNNEIYPFHGRTGARPTVLDNYAGRNYHRLLMIQYCWWLRNLTREVERYANTAKPDGPRPEWWQDIQAMREERLDPAGNFQFVYRRPTRYEYALQAYLALANGARGITVYPYKGNFFMDEYRDMNGEPLPRQQPPRPGKTTQKNTHGLYSDDWRLAPDSLKPALFRKPFSAALGNPDYNGQGTEWEPYPGEHYPYDRVADLFADLHTLLPILRGLRWWWATDGLDTSYADTAGTHHEQIYPRKSLRAWMEDSAKVHDSLSMGQRFRLRAIHNDDDGPVPNRPGRFSSNIYAGMFDDPADPSHEVYMLVNMTTNRIAGDHVEEAENETLAELIFNGDSPLDARVVWHDADRGSRPPLEEYTDAAGNRAVVVPLLPGDTKLIRVASN